MTRAVLMQWLTKAGDEKDLKEMIDIKSNILDVLEKHKKFNIAMSKSTHSGEAGETIFSRKGHSCTGHAYPQVLYHYLFALPLHTLPPLPLTLSPPSSTAPPQPLLPRPERVSIPGRGNWNRTQPLFRLSLEHFTGKGNVHDADTVRSWYSAWRY